MEYSIKKQELWVSVLFRFIHIIIIEKEQKKYLFNLEDLKSSIILVC